MKKFTRQMVLIGAVAATLAVAGCGGGDSDTVTIGRTLARDREVTLADGSTAIQLGYVDGLTSREEGRLAATGIMTNGKRCAVNGGPTPAIVGGVLTSKDLEGAVDANIVITALFEVSAGDAERAIALGYRALSEEEQKGFFRIADCGPF